MNDKVPNPAEFTNEQASVLFDEAFPKLACLRCGNEKFFLEGSASTFDTVRTALMAVGRRDVDAATMKQRYDLICSRCGFVEQPRVEELLQAKKPIGPDR